MKSAGILVLLGLLIAGSAGCLDEAPAAPKASITPAPKNETRPPEMIFDGVMALRPEADPPPLRFQATKNYTFVEVRMDITRAQCSLGLQVPLQQAPKVTFRHPNGTFSMSVYMGGLGFSGTCQGPDTTYLLGVKRVITPAGDWTVTTDARGLAIRIGVRATGYWDEPPKEPGAMGGK